MFTRNLYVAGILAGVMSIAPGLAFAGNYARGYGVTPTEATENALKAAEAAVRSVGRGCVGPGKDPGFPATRYVGKDGDLYIIEAYYNDNDGSCGIRKSLKENLKAMGLG